MPKYRKYSDQDLIVAVANGDSLADVCRSLKLVPIGGNYQTIKNCIFELNLSTAHFTRAAQFQKHYKPMGALRRNDSIKKHLIRKYGHQCFKCGNTEWNGLPIALEVEHISGESTDNSEDNLSLLCPNCHAQTPTYRRKKSSLKLVPSARVELAPD